MSAPPQAPGRFERLFPIPAHRPLLAALIHFRSGGRFVSVSEFRLAISGVLEPDEADSFRQWGLEVGATAQSAAELFTSIESRLATSARGGST